MNADDLRDVRKLALSLLADADDDDEMFRFATGLLLAAKQIEEEGVSLELAADLGRPGRPSW